MAAELSAKQMVFISEYLKDRNGTQAAIRAGYSERTAGEQASRLLANVKIKQYLNRKEENINRDLREMFAEEAVNAFKVMRDIMDKPEALDKDRIAVAKDLLDRAGYKPVERLAAEVTTKTYEEQLSELDDDG